jgi:hypothetical protein
MRTAAAETADFEPRATQAVQRAPELVSATRCAEILASNAVEQRSLRSVQVVSAVQLAAGHLQHHGLPAGTERSETHEQNRTDRTAIVARTKVPSTWVPLSSTPSIALTVFCRLSLSIQTVIQQRNPPKPKQVNSRACICICTLGSDSWACRPSRRRAAAVYHDTGCNYHTISARNHIGTSSVRKQTCSIQQSQPKTHRSLCPFACAVSTGFVEHLTLLSGLGWTVVPTWRWTVICERRIAAMPSSDLVSHIPVIIIDVILSRSQRHTLCT